MQSDLRSVNYYLLAERFSLVNCQTPKSSKNPNAWFHVFIRLTLSYKMYITTGKDTKISDSTNCTKNVEGWEKWIKSYTLYPHSGCMEKPVN